MKAFQFPDEHSSFNNIEIKLISSRDRCKFWTGDFAERMKVQAIDTLDGNVCHQATYSQYQQASHIDLDTRDSQIETSAGGSFSSYSEEDGMHGYYFCRSH
jgi:hypothetical protein